MARLKIAPRFWRDLEALLEFTAQQPWGDPAARFDDVIRVLRDVTDCPEHRPIVVHQARTGQALRRFDAAQFTIIYHYESPTPDDPAGTVWVRALRHSRVMNVFRGVREQPQFAYGARTEAA